MIALCNLSLTAYAYALLFCLVWPQASAFSPLPPPSPSHTILFDEVGHMASSMTYIHIAIPLNVSTLKHQLNLFNSYLQHFLTLTTNQTSEILFTKTIRDLAHFAESRLLHIATKINYINNLLPTDSANLSPRHKRFFMIAPYLMCQEDLEYCRKQSLEDDAKWQHKLSQCQRKLKAMEDHQNSYPDFPEFHDVFFNETYPVTSTTTPPPATFFAFRSTSPPYHSSSNRTQRSLSLSSKKLFFNLIDEHVRTKRQILAGLGLFSGVIGTFLGLYNQHEISNIQKQLLQFSDQQTLLTNIVQKHNHLLNELTRDMVHLTNIVRTLITYNPALVYAKLEQNVRFLEERVLQLMNVLQQLQHHRLSVDLLDQHQLQVLLSAVSNTASSRNLQPIPTKPTDYFQLDASYLRVDDDILILLHVPCVANNHMLTIYRYVPFPYPVSSTPLNASDPHPPIYSSLDVLSRGPHKHSALFFRPETELIAIGRTSANGQARYQLLSQAILAGCIQQNHIFLCDRHQLLRKDLPGSCLGALFIQHQQGVVENCGIEYRPLRETVYQLSTNDHLVFSPTPFSSQIQCTNGSHYPQQLVGITKIHVPDFCSLDLINHTIVSDGNIRISPKALQMHMTLDLNLFPSEMIQAASHTDNEMNLMKTSMASIHNLTTSEEAFANLLTSHLTSFSPVSIILWTLAALTFSGYVFFVCWYCNVLRNRRAALHRRRNGQSDVEAGSPLHPLPPLEDEDEISYIARTGTVNGIRSRSSASGQK